MALFAVVSVSARAHVPGSSCEESLGLGRLETGLGARGYLGTSNAIGDAEMKQLHARGILSWNERIFVVKNEDDAIRLAYVSARLPHLAPFANSSPRWVEAWKTLEGRELIRSALEFAYLTLGERSSRIGAFNPLMSGLYVIAPRADLRGMSPEKLAKFKRSLSERPIFEIDEEGRLTRLDPELVRTRLDPSQMVLDKTLDLEPQHLVQHGFFYPRQRAFLDLEKIPAPVAEARSNDRRYRFRLVPHREGLTIEIFDARAVKSRDVVASVHGTVQNGIYVLDSRHVRRRLPTYARFPVVSLRDELMGMGIVAVDATKVWQMQNHPRGEFVSGDEFGRRLGNDLRRD